jgi:hypothetical protein
MYSMPTRRYTIQTGHNILWSCIRYDKHFADARIESLSRGTPHTNFYKMLFGSHCMAVTARKQSARICTVGMGRRLAVSQVT